jgi:hypothetical protein
VKHFGLAVGSLVLIINVVLLAGTPSAAIRCAISSAAFSIPSRRRRLRELLQRVSCLNRKHMLWAWLSLFWVGFTDVYIRLCAMGIWHDFRFFTFYPKTDFGHQLRNF